MSCANTARSAKFTGPNEEETTRRLFSDRADSGVESFGVDQQDQGSYSETLLSAYVFPN